MIATRLLHLLPFLHATLGNSEQNSASSPRCDGTAFSNPEIGLGVEVLSILATHQSNYTSDGQDPTLSALNGLNFCQVQVYLTHKGTDDKVLVEVWLPLTHEEWNGRFQATGGGGLSTGAFDSRLGGAVQHGWAAVSTDGGHPTNPFDASWALNEDRSVNWNLLNNFATRSLVDQIAVGKSITEQYFGKKPHHSYWNGCSTGGRQGYAIAQKYPQLLDGILANAPAINFAHFVIGELHPQILMKTMETYMSSCELDYFRWKTIEHCDMLDGVRDGILNDPELCDFNPHELVGDIVECDGSELQVTESMAQLVIGIQKGFRTFKGAPVWHGLAPGVPMNGLANIMISNEGLRSQNPFPVSTSWLKYAVLRDPSFNLSSLDILQFGELLAQASYEYGGLLNAENPDLSTLQASGTKLLTWHGLDDDLIPFQNTVAYRKRVEGAMGGAQTVNDFYRLFLVPGVQHCTGGIGPIPVDPMAALVSWVEDNQPPETLDAETTNEHGEIITRELCAWPGKQKYMGIGDSQRASSWSCVGGTERSENDVNPELQVDQPQIPMYPVKDIEEEEEVKKDTDRAGKVLEGLKDRLEGLGIGLAIG